MLAKTVRHVLDGREVLETDVRVGTIREWERRKESADPEWEAVHFDDYIVAVRPVPDAARVRPRGAGIWVYPWAAGRVRVAHYLGASRRLHFTELLIYAGAAPDDPGLGSAWQLLRWNRWNIFLAPVVAPDIRSTGGPEARRGDVGRSHGVGRQDRGRAPSDQGRVRSPRDLPI